MKNNQRETFSSGLAVFFATLGSAVGLGNIWKFPYVIGANGGAAFLLIYFLCVLFVGLPVMISEFYMGRKTRKNVMGAIKELSPSAIWKSIGVFGIITAYLIMFFYTCVAGWVYSYVFKAIRGDFAIVTAESSKKMFETTTIGPLSPIIWQIIVLIVVSVIIIMGVQKGIEKVTKTLMPVLFLLIIICDIKAMMLPGASEGLKFLFKIDFSILTKQSILIALGLAFFKLSVGMGTMVTYGSYFTEDNNLINTSVKVALSDTLVSVLAGIAIFPAVFAFNMQPSAGPGLLFMTIPLVFSKIPFGNVLLILFFMLTAIAATTAMMSILEVLIAYFTEERGFTRKKAVIFNSMTIALIGTLASLSADSGSILGNIKIFDKRFFDIFDFISSNILMPIGGLLIILFIGYFVKKDDIKYELSNHNTLNMDWAINLYYFIVRFVTPILLIVVFLNSIGIIKF